MVSAMAMDLSILSTGNAKTSENHKLRLELISDLRLENAVISLSHLSLYYTWKNFLSKYNNVTCEYTHIPSNTLVKITIPDGSYSVRDLNNYIHHVMSSNNHVNSDESFGINIYANPVYNRITIKVSNDYEFNIIDGLRQTLGFSQSPLTNGDFNGEDTPQIEKVNNVLVHCNLVNNRVVNDSSVIHSFVPNNSFGSILSISPNYPFWHNTRNASFKDIEVWLTDQNNEPLDIEDNILVELQISRKSNL